MRPGSLTIVAGGSPSGDELAALTAALTVLVEGERGILIDPAPPAYRSRWRRAAMIETTEVAGHLKDDGPAWGVH